MPGISDACKKIGLRFNLPIKLFLLDINEFFNNLQGLDGIGVNGEYTYVTDTTSLGIPNQLTYLGANKTVVEIGTNAFGNCEDITEIIMEALLGMQGSCLKVLIDPQIPNSVISRLINDVTEFYKEYNEVTESGVLKMLIESKGLKVEDVVKAFYIIILGGILLFNSKYFKHINDKLVSYKVPSYVFFYDEFPLNSTGKIDSVQLKETAREEVKKK